MKGLTPYFLIFLFFSSSDLNSQQLLLDIKVDGKEGYIDTAGRIVIAPQFTYGLSFDRNGLAIVKLDKKYQVIDTSGKLMKDLIFENYIGSYNWNGGSRIVVKKNGKYGVLDAGYNEIVPFIYDEVSGFQGGIALATRGKTSGYLNWDGQFTALNDYQRINNMGYGFLAVQKFEEQDIMWIYNTKTQKEELGPYDDSNMDNDFNFGKLVVYEYTNAGRHFIINTKGEIIISPKKNYFIYSPTFTDSVYTIILHEGNSDVEKWGIMDNKGNIVLKPTKEYYGIHHFDSYKHGVFTEYRVKSKMGTVTYGIMDAAGNIIIEASYEDLLIYDEEKIHVKINGKWGIMNWQEAIIVPAIYNNCRFHGDDIMEIKVGEDYDEKRGYINIKTGKVIWPLTYTHERH
jgi:hypothetical protein